MSESGGPQTGGASETGAGSDESGTGGATSEGLDTGEVSTGSTGSAGSTSSAEGSSGGETAGEDTGPALDGLVLDPDTITAFWLPINSIRVGVGGFDAATNTCVTVVFQGDDMDEHCMFDPMNLDPYVVVTVNSAPPCEQWDYAGSVEIDSVSGCRQITAQDPEVDLDMVFEVTGAAYSGKITIKRP